MYVYTLSILNNQISIIAFTQQMPLRNLIDVLFYRKYSMDTIGTIIVESWSAVVQCTDLCLSLPNYNLSLPIWVVIPPYFRYLAARNNITPETEV